MFSKAKTKFKSVLSALLSATMFVSGFSLATGVTVGSAVDTNAATTSSSEYESSVFSWDNATVYFLLTDRFYNGDTSNDHSYGRGLDQDGNVVNYEQAAAFQGGDFAGITKKINEGYFDDLGVNAIWLSAPYEQIHGYVVGGGNTPSFAHYSYHGYYVLDYTEPDLNFGTKEEFQTLVDTAHEHGIRIVMDIVMNHSGYNSIKDMSEYGFGTLNSGWESYYYAHQNVNNTTYHGYINYNSSASDWAKWWGPDWIRCGLPGYTEGSGDIEGCLAGLPDFKTGSNASVTIPELLKTKWTKEGTYSQKVAKYGSSNTVTGYISDWLAEWVREFGVDGFRCDTAKHVELSAWKTLKDKCVTALREWKAENPDKALDDLDFWMTGECFGHGLAYSNYFTSGGFDSMINFEFAPAVGSSNIPGMSSLESVYSRYASSINTNDNFNVLSYISSHDTVLAAGDRKYAGAMLLMMPGGVQIYYGDETCRPVVSVPSDAGGGAGHQLRSFMNWDSLDNNVLSYWQKLGQFRRNHIAVGAGTHKCISPYSSSTGYTFSRIYSKNNIEDKVVVTIGAAANTDITIDVSSVWADGTVINNFYDGTSAIVSNGKVTFNSGANGTILLEEPVGAKYKVIVNHVLQSTGEVLKTEIKKGELGESYTVSPDEELLENYYVAKTVGSTTGKFTEEDKTVTFYYAFDANKKGTLTVKYIDKDTGAEIAASQSLIGDIGASYSVSPITIKNYEVVTELLPSNASGTYKKGNIEVVFKYQYVEPDTLKVHYYTTSWSNVNCYAYSEETTVTEYLGAWPGKAMTKGSDGWYTIEIDTESALVIFNNGTVQDPTGSTSAKGYEATGECWIKDGNVYPTGKVVVLYTDTSGNLIEKQTLTGIADGSATYTTEKKSFDGYTYSSVSGQTSGTFTEGTITVTYVYAPDNTPAKDKTALLAKINEAKTYLNGEYTSSSLSNLQTAITAAQKVYNSSTATQAEVNAQVKALNTAIEALVSTNPIDKSDLYTNILVANVYLGGQFTESSLNNLSSALKSAQAVYDSTSSTQIQINAQTTALENAINALVEDTSVYIYVELASGVSLKPYVYSWEGESTALTGAWPGTPMTSCGNGKYKIAVPATGSTYNFIINDGTQNKTTDIENVSGTQYVLVSNATLTNSSSYKLVSTGDLTTDKTELSKKLAEAESKITVSSNYTVESVNKLKNAQKAGQIVYDKVDATQLEIDVQVAYITGAIAGLKEAVEDDVTITDFTATSTNLTLGNSTTLKTTATGSNLKYKYAYTTGSGWTVIRAYSATSSYTWKPTAAGTYTVRAFVTDGTTTAKKDITIKVTKASSSLAISSLKSFSTNNTASVGDAVKFGVTATGTTSTTKYKFEYTRTGKTWATIKNYSTSRYASWTPKYAGTYTIRVTAKDGTATDTKTMTFVVNAKGTTTSITSFTSSKTSMYVLDSATLNVKATGSNLKYKFAYQYNGSWKVIQAYSTSSTCTFTPNNTGTYTVRVFVDDGTNVLRKDITITVK